MSRFFIKTEKVISNIEGKAMFIDGDYLYVYGEGENDLRGMYRADQVIMAYRTEERQQQNEPKGVQK